MTPHTLRHSYATGLLEAGVDLLAIGRLLGHKSFTTTMIYLHLRRPYLESNSEPPAKDASNLAPPPVPKTPPRNDAPHPSA